LERWSASASAASTPTLNQRILPKFNEAYLTVTARTHEKKPWQVKNLQRTF
jgi:hypothetical protein